jgi:hypothetical protein
MIVIRLNIYKFAEPSTKKFLATPLILLVKKDAED